MDGYTLHQLAARSPAVALPAYRYRFRQLLQRFVGQPNPLVVPAGPLVLLADGLWFQFAGRPWVLYLTAVKPCQSNYAVFLDPLLLAGTERAVRWQQVLTTLPPAVTARVRALVVDNLPGLQRLAAQREWVLQLCHFHLLLKLRSHHSVRPRALRGGPVRDELAQYMRHALELPPGPSLRVTLHHLHRLAGADCGTPRIRMIVRAFLRDLAYYRSYRQYPELGLPRTTNSVESMGRLLRELFRRHRAGSSPTSVLRWATAFIRLRPRVVCNGCPLNRFS